MKLSIVAMGQRMPAWADAACAEYAKRLPREFGFGIVELKPAPRDRPVAAILAQESLRIAEAVRGARMVALDECGSAWSSEAFAARLGTWRDEALDVAFVIGSADGLDPSLKRGAMARLSLSAMTLPHALARVLLCEQVWRAWSLLSGHPYHRA